MAGLDQDPTGGDVVPGVEELDRAEQAVGGASLWGGDEPRLTRVSVGTSADIVESVAGYRHHLLVGFASGLANLRGQEVDICLRGWMQHTDECITTAQVEANAVDWFAVAKRVAILEDVNETRDAIARVIAHTCRLKMQDLYGRRAPTSGVELQGEENGASGTPMHPPLSLEIHSMCLRKDEIVNPDFFLGGVEARELNRWAHRESNGSPIFTFVKERQDRLGWSIRWRSECEQHIRDQSVDLGKGREQGRTLEHMYLTGGSDKAAISPGFQLSTDPRHCPVPTCMHHRNQAVFGGTTFLATHLDSLHTLAERTQLPLARLKIFGLKRCDGCQDIVTSRGKCGRIGCPKNIAGGDPEPVADGDMDWMKPDLQLFFMLEGTSASSIRRDHRAAYSLSMLFAEAVEDVERSLNMRGDVWERAFRRLLVIVPLVLQKDERGRSPNDALIHARIRDIRGVRGAEEGLWNSLLERVKEARSSRNQWSQEHLDAEQSRLKQELFKARRAKVCLQKGEVSRAAAVVAREKGLLPVDDPVMEKLKGIFVQQQAITGEGDEFGGPVQNLLERVIVDDDLLEAAVRKSSSATAPDASGGSNSLVKQFWSYASMSVRKLVIWFAKGLVPTNLLPYLAGSRMCVFDKSKEGQEPRPRPIEICSVWRKIAAKCINGLVLPKVRRVLEPLQLGVGGVAAVDRIVHVLRMALAQDDSHVLACLDLSNAFNRIDRVFLLKQLKKFGLQELIPYFRAYYGQTRKVRVTRANGAYEWLDVSGGVMQGDVLAGMLFAIGFHVVLTETQKRNLAVIVKAFLDDLSLTGSCANVLKFIRDLSEILVSSGSGLALNPDKTKIQAQFRHGSAHLTEQQRDDLEDLGRSESALIGGSDGCVVLGVPLGTDEFVTRKAHEAMTEAIRQMEAAVTVCGPGQEAYLMVRYCMNVKMPYLARSVPPRLIKPIASVMDGALVRVMSRIVGMDIRSAPLREEVMRWKVSQGGLGLPSLAELCEVMYIGAFFDARSYAEVDYAEATCPRAHKELPRDTWIPREIVGRAMRAKWIRCVNQKFGNIPVDGHPPDTLRFLYDARCAYAVVSPLWAEKVNGGPVVDKSAPHPFPCNFEDQKVEKQLTHKVSTLFSEKQHGLLFPRLPGELQAKARSASTWGASECFNVMPSSQFFSFEPAVFAEVLRRRLCLRQPGADELGNVCVACRNWRAGRGVCDFWSHEEMCAGGGDKIHGHDALVADLRTLLIMAGERVPRCEPRGVFEIFNQPVGQAEPDNHSRGGPDISLCVGGTTTLYDVTVISNLRADVVVEAARYELHAAGVAVKRKNDKFLTACQAIGFGFHPLVFETGGAMSEAVTRMVSACAGKISMGGCADYEELQLSNTWTTRSPQAYWMQRLSCCLLRWVARNCLRVRGIQRRHAEWLRTR